MSVYVLNNNDVTSIVAKTYTQLTGAEIIGTVNLKGLIGLGNEAGILESKDAFLKTLANVMYDRIYTTDRDLMITENNVFYVDSNEWGGILAAVDVDIPSTLIPNRSWNEMTSGVTTLGTSTAYLPTVTEKIYGPSISYSLPMTVSHSMMKTAFKGEEDMLKFMNAVYVACRNAVKEYHLGLDRANRNNYMAELISYAGSQGATGIHVIDLNALYQATVGNDSTSVTREEFLNTAACMIFAAETIDEYRGYLEEPSVLFNVEGKDRFVPEGEVVVQVLRKFEKRLEYEVKSDTYHKNIVALPNHRTVTAWQGFGTGTTFDEMSSINVKTTDNVSVSRDGIVAFMCHPYAIMHRIMQERVAAKYYDFEDATQTEWQFVDQYANHLGLPAIVFVIDDYTVETPGD